MKKKDILFALVSAIVGYTLAGGVGCLLFVGLYVWVIAK